MGILEKVTPAPIRQQIVRGIEAIVPEQYRHHIPNVITGLGVIATTAGVFMDNKKGVALRLGGHIADDVDGSSAKKWGKLGKFGKWFDAFADKYRMTAELGATTYAMRHLMDSEKPLRKVFLAEVAAKHAVSASLNGLTEKWGGEASTHAFGRVNTWFDGLAFGFLAGADHTDRKAHPTWHSIEVGAGYIFAALGTATGVGMTAVYAGKAMYAFRQLHGDTPVDESTGVVVSDELPLAGSDEPNIGLAGPGPMPDTL